ncbi:MAG: DUF2442 domain-containing protein [Pirellulales bacterium]
MKPTVKDIRVAGRHRLAVAYEDGLAATLDFSEYLTLHVGPIIEPLRDQEIFATVQLDHGAVTWSTGFDICPDVLRFWCEQGRVCADQETDAYFESQRLLSTQ